MSDLRTTFFRRQSWLIAIAAVAIVFAYTVAVEASRPRVIEVAPTAVAVIDVARLVQEIDERGEWDMRLESLQASVNQEAQDRQKLLSISACCLATFWSHFGIGLGVPWQLPGPTPAFACWPNPFPFVFFFWYDVVSPPLVSCRGGYKTF